MHWHERFPSMPGRGSKRLTRPFILCLSFLSSWILKKYHIIQIGITTTKCFSEEKKKVFKHMVKSYCLSSSLKSSRLLFFFSLSLLFFEVWSTSNDVLIKTKMSTRTATLGTTLWLWQYLHFFYLQAKTEMESPKAGCFLLGSQNVTWACITFLFSHQKLLHL